jgi:tetratricopeptide (TPR) repeat protein
VAQLRVDCSAGAEDEEGGSRRLCVTSGAHSRVSSHPGVCASITLFKQALAIDLNYAAAWDGLARDYTNETGYGLRPVPEGLRLAREAVEAALAADPDYAPAYDTLGWIAKSYDGDLAAAARYYEHALALARNGHGDSRQRASARSGSRSARRCHHSGPSTFARGPINRSREQSRYAYLFAGRVDEAIGVWKRRDGSRRGIAYSTGSVWRSW